jgi:hypothetical protein
MLPPFTRGSSSSPLRVAKAEWGDPRCARFLPSRGDEFDLVIDHQHSSGGEVATHGEGISHGEASGLQAGGAAERSGAGSITSTVPAVRSQRTGRSGLLECASRDGQPCTDLVCPSFYAPPSPSFPSMGTRARAEEEGEGSHVGSRRWGSRGGDRTYAVVGGEAKKFYAPKGGLRCRLVGEKVWVRLL